MLSRPEVAMELLEMAEVEGDSGYGAVKLLGW